MSTKELAWRGDLVAIDERVWCSRELSPVERMPSSTSIAAASRSLAGGAG